MCQFSPTATHENITSSWTGVRVSQLVHTDHNASCDSKDLGSIQKPVSHPISRVSCTLAMPELEQKAPQPVRGWPLLTHFTQNSADPRIWAEKEADGQFLKIIEARAWGGRRRRRKSLLCTLLSERLSIWVCSGHPVLVSHGVPEAGHQHGPDAPKDSWPFC